MASLVQADRKAVETQITGWNKSAMQKSIYSSTRTIVGSNPVILNQETEATVGLSQNWTAEE